MKKTSLFLALALTTSGIFGSTVCSTTNNEESDLETTIVVACINPAIKNVSLDDVLDELNSQELKVCMWKTKILTTDEFNYLFSQYSPNKNLEFLSQFTQHVPVLIMPVTNKNVLSYLRISPEEQSFIPLVVKGRTIGSFAYSSSSVEKAEEDFQRFFPFEDFSNIERLLRSNDQI